MPSAFGRHPGAAAVIRPIVHDRAAFGLSLLPTETFLPMPTVFPVGTSTHVPPGVATLLLRLHPCARRCILRRLRRHPAAAWLTLAFDHVLCRGSRVRDSSSRENPNAVPQLLKAPASLPRKVLAPFPSLYVPKLR